MNVNKNIYKQQKLINFIAYNYDNKIRAIQNKKQQWILN